MSPYEQIMLVFEPNFWKFRRPFSKACSLILAILVVVLAASAQATAQSPSLAPLHDARIISQSDSRVSPALYALIGVIFSVIVSWFIARRTAKLELAKRQSDLALKISEMVSVKDENQRRAAMRRFAVAVVKVVESETHEEIGKVYFIPMNSRVTVGRSEDNDIVLRSSNKYLSRWHCGFISDQRNVWIDDYKSKNGTKIKGFRIEKPRMLESGDEIEIGPFKLHFQAIRENTILAQ